MRHQTYYEPEKDTEHSGDEGEAEVNDRTDCMTSQANTKLVLNTQLMLKITRTETSFNPIDGPIDGHRWDLNYRPAHGGTCGAF